jgi:hypothetical protein
VLLNDISDEKLQDYDNYPLTYRLGFIHLITEMDFDIASATIIDAGYLELFPKLMLQTLLHYARHFTNNGQEKRFYMALIGILITAFIYRPITIQRFIQIMMAKEKNQLNSEMFASVAEVDNADQNDTVSLNTQSTINQRKHESTPQMHRICVASKCQLLQAKGILRRPMFCLSNKNRCSGCLNELQHQ